ncbi:mitochondrial chaperone bcs1 [Colletotrichum abscissum]
MQPPSHPTSHQVSIMDIFFPGFTGVTAALHQLLNGNLDSYAGLLCICGLVMVCASKTDVHDPDEAYDMLECWISAQDFAKNACSSLNESAFFLRKTMTVSCFGRSSQILRDLMDECRLEYLRLSENKTSIFEHHNNGWKRTMTRDIRPMETVVMNKEIKQMLLEDIRYFLNPTARSWYANRGLPYRRGYLLYGPPGTGKSSISMSVAGCFGLDIYVLSLAGINDGRLSTLFAELPQRCVVLLEDVDAVGTTQARNTDADESDSGSEVSRSPSKPPATLSLSGLLNVLDGVASQEGRVLFMTTNHREHLDDALIRPGRVDTQIEFQLADADMTRKLFCNVFEQSQEEFPDAEAREKSNKEVRQLSFQFAAMFPELEYSPADILSFLLAKRSSPSSALADAAGPLWMLAGLDSYRGEDLDKTIYDKIMTADPSFHAKKS